MPDQAPTSLYTRWREVASRRDQAIAVREFPSGRAWTFAELEGTGEEAEPAPHVLQTARTGFGFLTDVLRAWRDGAVLVPDDTGGTFHFDASGIPAGVCHVKVTSGSTGNRQGVMFDAAALAADARQIIATMGLHEDLPNLGVISLAHSYGFSNLVTPLLLEGIPLFLAESPLPGLMREILVTATASGLALPAVPAMWRAWEQAGLDFSGVRIAISAGAPLPLELEHAVHARTGLKIHNFYGSSECGGIAYDRSDMPRDDAGIVGSAIHGVELSVDGESGCLRVNSAAIGLGYLGSENGFAVSGYLTGDLAEIRNENIHLLGRTGDTIHVAGYKVAPRVIEDALLRVPGLRCCVVFGVPSPDPVRGEEVVAVISGAVESAELRAALAHLPSAYLPRHWWPNDDLSPDARGKVSRAFWKSLWLERERSRKSRADLAFAKGKTDTM
jgi:acyl-coenzyme A synthetase/AMP-(fatty) acid ligase